MPCDLHSYVCKYIQIYTRTYIHEHIRASRHTYMHAYMHKYLHPDIHTYAHTLWLMHACICICIYDRILNIADLHRNTVCMYLCMCVCMVCANQHDLKNSLIE